MKKYRKKPIIIEAEQWKGQHFDELIEATIEIDDGDDVYCEDCLAIKTLEGTMRVNKGDWIIKGIKGEFYPCKDEIFKLSYEEVE